MSPTQTQNDIQNYIRPLNMNGLQGRMLRAPSTTKRTREILFIYGHHSLIERWWGLVQNLQAYGNVTVPDLPGFGGMDSFYTIGSKPTIDNLADYLASFIKLRYKRRRITIMGVSFGFVVATRMLQKYPDLASRVDMLVSAVGFAHHDDFLFSPARKMMYRTSSRLVSLPLVAPLFRGLFLNAPILTYAYGRTHNARHKFRHAASAGIDFKALMDAEIRLWQQNDVRTHMYTTHEFLKLDNCRSPVHLPVWHIYSETDHYFDNAVVEQHLRIIFRDVFMVRAESEGHTVPVTADKQGASAFLPKAVRLALAREK